jgi:glycosyltransferase involved in cell wall biosynthesis
MAGYVETLNGVRKSASRVVYNWHNIESEAMRRYSDAVPSSAKKLYAAYTQRRLAALEREILKTAFGHIVCSEREGDQLLQLAPRARITVVENGVDTVYFSGRKPGVIRRHLVFVGLMNYYPNVEAAVSFARTLWPGVFAKFPSLSLRIVGASPTSAVLALKEIPGVEVTGTVPDVRPYYEDALAAIVPLRTGGGTRLKILEAMAAGVPVISTQLGAEGLSTTPEQNILTAAVDDRESWIRQITRLVESPEQFERISTSALNLVKSQYDWQILGSKLFAIYEEWLHKAG